MELTQKQQLYLASTLAYLREAPVPMRAPGWEEQGYWGRPIAQSKVRLIPDNPAWQILEQVSSIDDYNTVIRHYTAAPVYMPPPPGIEFRLRVDSKVLDLNLVPGVDRHHIDNQNNFPLIRQMVQYVFTDESTFYLECRNQSGGSVYIASALYGWHYFDPVGELSGSGEAMIDAGGRTYHEEMPDPSLEFFSGE